MKIIIILLSLFSLDVLAHCPITFKSTNLCADITWLDGPYDGKTSQMEVVFWESGDHSHEPVSPEFDVKIYSWMVMNNGHSHGGPKFSSQEVLPGVFQAKEVRMFMGRMKGFWQIKIDLSQNNKVFSSGAKRVKLK